MIHYAEESTVNFKSQQIFVKMTTEDKCKFKSLDEEFDFYLRFTKPFVLNKSNSKDRTHAAVWIKKLMNEEDKSLRLDYLKLLLFALQKPALIGPFKCLPPDCLEPLPEGHSILELISSVLEETEKDSELKSHPVVTAQVAHDLTEYAAVQEIPNFGIQCFYATSPISINQWHLTDEYSYPRKYIYGAEAWEQSLSQLYHTDIAGNLIKAPREEQKISIDCCTDKPKVCRDSDVYKVSSLEFRVFDAENENRGPKSPWICKETHPCEHVNNQREERGNFSWDKFSRVDSSYNIQPNTDLQGDFILNDHGLAQFEMDQIAILLANKSKQSEEKKDRCFNAATKETIQEKSEENIDDSSVHRRKCPHVTTSYNPELMQNQYNKILTCEKNDPHPSKLKIKLTNNCNDSFDDCPLEDTPDNYVQTAKYKEDNSASLTENVTHQPREDQGKNNVAKSKSWNIDTNVRQLKCIFDQEIPIPMHPFKSRIEKLNYYKTQKYKGKLENLARKCSNCCQNIEESEEPGQSNAAESISFHTCN